MGHSVVIHPSVTEGRPGCLQVWAIVSKYWCAGFCVNMFSARLGKCQTAQLLGEMLKVPLAMSENAVF